MSDFESESELGQRMARTISASGPLSVAQFMAEANAHYYAARDPFGAAGDFITAPEISQIFGELVGLWLTDLWIRAKRPTSCHYVEFGPGRGTLARDAQRTMARFNFRPSVHLVESSPLLRAKQAELVPEARWHDDLETLPADGPLLIVANEFFDALPIRQMVATGQGWRERVVTWDQGRFLPIAGARPMDAAVPSGFRKAKPGTVLETSPAASAVAFGAARRIAQQGGALLAIDYGYADVQSGSSLQAVSGHESVDPFERPGNRDLTAHVNFGELVQIGRSADLKVFGPVSQGLWLSALGIHQRAEVLLRNNPGKAENIEAAVRRLVDRRAMGELFKVMAYGTLGWPSPEGFPAAP